MLTSSLGLVQKQEINNQSPVNVKLYSEYTEESNTPNEKKDKISKEKQLVFKHLQWFVEHKAKGILKVTA